MAILKCKMCGGDVVLAADKTFGTCEYCGCTMTFPKVNDDQRAAAFNRGNHFRRIGEFDKALEVYERIVAEDENDAEAHWCCALCRFGIEYVEDPTTYEWLPTCHRASFDSFLEDVDFLSALEHSDGVTRRQYQKDAAKIAEVQRGILATSQNTEPYDVFICYKELDENGNRTRDSILAQEIYYRLKDRDWRVFFSRISLEDVPGTQYEPYIFAALNSALVMVVVGTSAENLNSVWVKNEWSRFLSLMKKDRSKLLIPCYRDMDPYDLPDQLSVLMSYDIGRIGFIQDLIRGVDKVLSAEKKDSMTETVKETVVVQQGGGPNVTALIKRGNLALEDGEWESANNFFDQALNMDAECAEAYLGMGLSELRCHSTDEYIQRATSQTPQVEKKSIQKDSERIRKAKEKYPIEGFLKWEEISGYYDGFDFGYQSKVNGQKAIQNRTMSDFEHNRHFARAVQFAEGESKTLLDEFRHKISDKLQEKNRLVQEDERSTITRLKSQYDDFLNRADQKSADKHKEAEQRREAFYVEACRMQETAVGVNSYQATISKFQRIRTYKDSLERIEQCKESIADLEKQEKLRIEAEKKAAAQAAAEKAERERIKKAEEKRLADHAAAEKAERERLLREKELILEHERNEKKKKIKLIAAIAVAVLAIASFFVVTKVVIPEQQRSAAYQEAAALYAKGDYVAAFNAYSQIKGYKDVDTLLSTDANLLAAAAAREAKLTSLKTVGSTVVFGAYEQDNNTSNGKEEIEWIVLENEGNQSLLISKYALDCQQYNATYTNVTWETCSIRTWLNKSFLKAAFSIDEQKAILTTTVDSSKSHRNSSYSTNYTKDQIFLLSYAEAGKYFSSNEARICKLTAYAKARGAYTDGNGNGWWWLRSPDLPQSATVTVKTDGSLRAICEVNNDDYVVRPAFWIDLDQVLNLPDPVQTTASDITMSAEPLYSCEFKVGDIYTFGSYEQDNNPDNGKEPIEWVVLDNNGNKSLLISRYGLDAKPYNQKRTGVVWETCSLREWLNREFLSIAFNDKEKEAIIEAEVDFYQSKQTQNWWLVNSNDIYHTYEYIFLPDYSEMKRLFGSDSERVCQPTAYAKAQGVFVNEDGNCSWWMRSPTYYEPYATMINAEGAAGIYYVDDSRYAIRPVLWVDLDSEYFK